MTFPRLFAAIALLLFGVIGIAAFFKGGKEPDLVPETQEIELGREIVPASTFSKPNFVAQGGSEPEEADRIHEFFNKGERKFPIVDTITYKSRVDWKQGRPAWISDYAIQYSTPRHFIARSLNGRPEYLKQEISEGDRFNILKPDKNIGFYLVVDLSRSKLWFYYLDLDQNQHVLVKTYNAGLGKVDRSKPSGLLTPLGKYHLGKKIALYKPGVVGFHKGQKQEMVSVYGTRWIPISEDAATGKPITGLGLQGVPWVPNDDGELAERPGMIGKYESEGPILLSTEDIEELYAIIVSRPTTVEIVKDFFEAKVPGTSVK